MGRPVPAVSSRPAPATRNAADIFAKKIQPFISTNCLECHDSVGSEGDLVLDKPALSTVESMRTQRATWERVLDHVSQSIMPPAESTLPLAPADRAEFVAALDQVLHPVDLAHPDPGHVVLRRLNREEYKNTVQDLLGTSFNPTADFPEDDTGYGFDNIGDVLTLSPLLFERYLAASRAVAKDMVPERLPASRTITGAADEWRGENTTLLSPTLRLDRPTRVTWHFTVPATGLYKIFIGAGSDGGTSNLHYNVELDQAVVATNFETTSGTRAVAYAQQVPEMKLTRGTHLLTVDYINTPAQAPPPGAPGTRGGGAPAPAVLGGRGGAAPAPGAPGRRGGSGRRPTPADH